MTARRALLDDETIEITAVADTVGTPRRAVTPALSAVAVEPSSSRTDRLEAIANSRVRSIAKAAGNRRRVVAPVAAIAAASALGVISTLAPAAATNNPSSPTSSGIAIDNADTAFQANALGAIGDGQASDEAVNTEIDNLAGLTSGTNAVVADAATKAAGNVQAAKDKEAADKAAAAALAEQESSASTPAASTGGKASSASSSSAQAALNFAMAQIGKPYVYGASGPDSYDCSGLMMAAYASAGISIPRTSEAQQSSLSSVSLSDLQPGDLVFFYGGSHVGMYIGNGQVVHAPTSGDVVKISDMNSMGPTGAARP